MRLSNRAIRANILNYLRAEPEPHGNDALQAMGDDRSGARRGK
jgi:hypothetical protein